MPEACLPDQAGALKMFDECLYVHPIYEVQQMVAIHSIIMEMHTG